MGRIFLFFTAIILCGVGGALGSIVGNAFGKTGLWVGGIVGGLVASSISSWIAAKAGWITPERRARTSVGTAIGFLLAASIAVNTLSTPIGPLLSTLLAGIGAVMGAGRKPSEEA